jgi:ABC-type multidrug transport system ATPase subunit
VETLADRVALLKDGQIIACDAPSHLRRMMKDRVEKVRIGLTGGDLNSRFFTVLKGLGGVMEVGLRNGMVEVTALDIEDLMPRLLKTFEGEGLRIIHLDSAMPSLEDTFRYLVKEEPA